MYLAAEGAHNPILPIWQEIVVGSISLRLLCFVLLKFVMPRMEAMYQARVDAIEGGLKRAEAAQAEANQLLEQYRVQLAEVRTEAAKIRDDARSDARGSVRTSSPRRGRIRSGHRRRQGAARRRARTIVRELRTEVGTIAVDLASKIVGESLADEARRKGTVDRFLSSLESTGAR